MLTVDQFAEIRRAHRDGMSIRAIARQLRHTRRTVRKALAQPEPAPYTRSKPCPAPKLGAFHAVIDAIVAADEQAPRKQRHTAAQIFRRLQTEHGYSGGYDQVRRYLQQHRRRQRETFIPLSHDPGQRAEADFGHVAVDFPDGRRQVPVLLVTWAYSNCPFAIALPSERTEAILHGLAEAFRFFGCVPRELWWDNPTTVASAILSGRERRLQPRYAALASHYNFEPLFCMPRRGNEKPRVENRVYDLQRRWATPVPRVRDLAELNTHLQRCCLLERERISGHNTETISVRFERDRAAALATPTQPFDACVQQPAQVDKYQTVRFAQNQYSVPRSCAFQSVTVKAYVDEIVVVAAGQIVARHPRSYGRGEQILDPQHYLSTLDRRPAALDHAPVYRTWQLPECFTQLRAELETRHGRSAGVRHYIRVLQLLEAHSRDHVAQAIEHCRQRGLLDAERIRGRVEFLAATDLAAIDASREAAASDLMATSSDTMMSLPSVTPWVPRLLSQVQVPMPDLRCFNQLLDHGGKNDVSDDDVRNVFDNVFSDVRDVVAQDQPQATAAAHDGSRV